MQEYLDGRGVSFADYRLQLPARASCFPPQNLIKSRTELAEFHDRTDACYSCGRTRRQVWRSLQCHHIMGGTKGRSDEQTNFAMLCADCHEGANTGILPMGRILFLKWLRDRENIDWVRLAVLRRCFLPDLET